MKLWIHDKMYNTTELFFTLNIWWEKLICRLFIHYLVVVKKYPKSIFQELFEIKTANQLFTSNILIENNYEVLYVLCEFVAVLLKFETLVIVCGALCLLVF